MNTSHSFRRLTTVFACLALLTVSAEGVSAQVVISEVFWMGSDLSTADEWIELQVTGTGSVDLSDWSLTTENSSHQEVEMVRFASGTIINPNQSFLVSNYAENQSRIAVSPNVVTTAISLPNTGLKLRLKDPSGLTRDEVDDGSGTPFAGTNGSNAWEKASMERVDLFGSGALMTSWRTATTTIHFDTGATILGTPGAPNGSWVDPFGSSSSSSAPTQDLPQLEISEVLPDLPGVDDEEWIEVTNTGTGVLSLSGFVLSVGSHDAGLIVGSGAVTELPAGQSLQLKGTQTGLNLRNAGDTISLTWNGLEVAKLTYPALPEGVSFGILDGTEQPFCVPTPGFPNTLEPWEPELSVQSGQTLAEGKVTLNLQVTIPSGSLVGSTCTVDYGDGHVVSSCNPPSHSFTKEGTYTITLTALSYCGTTVIHTIEAHVLPGASAKIRSKKKTSSAPFQCSASDQSGVRISELFPNPDTSNEDSQSQSEWIELENVSEQSVSMCGLSLDDEEGGSKPYALGDGFLAPLSFKVFPQKQTKIALNNSGDRVRLIQSEYGKTSTGVTVIKNTKVIHEIAYSEGLKNESYSLNKSGKFSWTPFLTPGRFNQFVDPETTIGSDGIEIILPESPEDKERSAWIELRNTTDHLVWMSNWELHVGKAKPHIYKLPFTFIAPHGLRHLKHSETMIDVPEKVDELRLYDDARRLIRVQTAPFDDRPWETAVVRKIHPDLSVSADVYDPHLRRPVYSERRISLTSIVFPEDPIRKKYIQKYVSTLLLGKIIDLQMYSKSEASIRTHAARERIEAALVRRGLAWVHPEASEQEQTLLAYQHEAEKWSIGDWGNEGYRLAMENAMREVRERKILLVDGLRVMPSIKPGLVESGVVLTLKANVPSTLSILSETGQILALYGSGIVLDHDAHIRVRAERDDAKPFAWSGSYVLRRSDYRGLLALSEVYPAPLSGEEEWMEITNLSPERVNLAGWIIDDDANGGSRPRVLPPLEIAGSGMIILPKSLTKMALNNEGDSITLTDPNNVIIDQITYSKMKKGQSVSIMGHRENSAALCYSVVKTPGHVNDCIFEKLNKKIVRKKVARNTSSKLKKIIRSDRKESEILKALGDQVGGRVVLRNPHFFTLQMLIGIMCVLGGMGLFFMRKR